MDPTLITTIALPLVMAIGGLLAWRKTMKHVADEEKPGWRDTSLDDWRNQRDAEIEAGRSAPDAGKQDGDSK